MQNLLISMLSGIVVLIFGVIVSLYIGSQLQSIQNVLDSTNQTITTILELVEVGPEGINEVAGAITENATETGTAIGEGAASVVDQVGTALQRFRN